MEDTRNRKKPLNDKGLCPQCDADTDDMVFHIDGSVDCYVCNWAGHEDEIWNANELGDKI